MPDAGVDLSFPHSYEVELIPELPGSVELKQVMFPKQVARYRLMIRVSPSDAPPWVGIFGGGYDSGQALTGVFSCPDRHSICVVSAGDGYIVRAENPDFWDKVSAFPITDVRPIRQRGVLVFADFTTLAAYGPNGLVWRSHQLSWDGLRITDVTVKEIKGVAWDSPEQQEVEFVVNVETGAHQGGASPETLAPNP